jgi:hypothetical protein
MPIGNARDDDDDDDDGNDDDDDNVIQFNLVPVSVRYVWTT